MVCEVMDLHLRHSRVWRLDSTHGSNLSVVLRVECCFVVEIVVVRLCDRADESLRWQKGELKLTGVGSRGRYLLLAPPKIT
jgi:hypothetical protein